MHVHSIRRSKANHQALVPLAPDVPLVPRFPKTILDCPMCRLCRDYGKPIARDRGELALHHVGALPARCRQRQIAPCIDHVQVLLTPQPDRSYLVPMDPRLPACCRSPMSASSMASRSVGVIHLVACSVLDAECGLRRVPCVVRCSRGGHRTTRRESFYYLAPLAKRLFQ